MLFVYKLRDLRINHLRFIKDSRQNDHVLRQVDLKRMYKIGLHYYLSHQVDLRLIGRACFVPDIFEDQG